MSKVISDVKSASHPVAASHPVNVRAIIGNAQKGAWVMLLDDVHVRSQTDRLSLIVEVDGPTTTTVQIAHTGDPGDSAGYSAIIFFA
jgi:hypothetical protein